MFDPQVVQDPQRVHFRGGFDDPREHQLRERGVANGVEPQPGVGVGEHLPQHRVTRAGDHGMPGRDSPGRQVELTLSRMQPISSLREQRRQVGVCVGRPEVLDHLVPAADTLSDLYRSGSRGGLHLPHERHDTDDTGPISVSIHPNATR